jgi:uncharacterized membrane protein (UPF0127 family)
MLRLLSGAALFALATLTAQAQTPAALGWCTTIPLPQKDIGSLVNAGETIHQARPAPCRILELQTPRRTLRLAVAATEAQREHGLMNVPYVPSGEGMLFAFPDTTDQMRFFWMKDTIAPLDMVFVDGDGTITTIAVNVPATQPGAPDSAIARRDGVGRYVIELGAGEAARLGLAAGGRLIIPPISAQ